MALSLVVVYSLLSIAYSQCVWNAENRDHHSRVQLNLTNLASLSFNASVDGPYRGGSHDDVYHLRYSVCGERILCGEDDFDMAIVDLDHIYLNESENRYECKYHYHWQPEIQPKYEHVNGGTWTFLYADHREDPPFFSPKFVCEPGVEASAEDSTILPSFNGILELEIKTKYACVGDVPINITCGAVESKTINDYHEKHYYQFIMNDANNVNFHLCHHDPNIHLKIFDSFKQEVTKNYRANRYLSNYCANGSKFAENLTIPDMSPGIYTILIEAVNVEDEIESGPYILSINCFSTFITCGDVVSNVFNINNIRATHHYQFIVNDSYDVNFETCDSVADVVVFIKDNLDNDISKETCPNGNFCGQCDNEDEHLHENFTIANMSAGVYAIEIKPYACTHESHDCQVPLGWYNLDITCILLPNNCVSDGRIIGSALIGIIQVIIALLVLWLVGGHFNRFGEHCKGPKIIIYSVVGCLLLAFVEGCVRSFILTNVFVPGAETILGLRCNGLFWHQIYVLQLGELLIYIYLLTRLRLLAVFQSAMYWCLLLFMSCTMIFTAAILPWYSIPIIENKNCNNSQLIMCINFTPSDHNLYEEYVIFLLVNVVAQFVLLFVFLYYFYKLCIESGDCSCERKNRFTYRILALGTIIMVFHLIEFVYFCINEQTFGSIRFIIYSIIIMLSFNICAINEETGDVRWCCWIYIKDKPEFTQLTGQTQHQHQHISDLHVDESIGLI